MIIYYHKRVNRREKTMEQQNNGKAIASLVLGIVSIATTVLFGSFGPIFALVTGIIAIVLGVKARKECPCGMATAGFVLGIIGTVFGAVMFLACACLIGGLAVFSEAGSFNGY